MYYGSAYMFAVSASAKLTQFAGNCIADYPIMAAPLYQLKKGHDAPRGHNAKGHRNNDSAYGVSKEPPALAMVSTEKPLGIKNCTAKSNIII